MLTRTSCIYGENKFTQEAPFPVISGRSIAHAKRSIPELALVGADLHLNRLTLISPTIKQSAHLAGVCAPYVAAAIARAAVLAGDCALLDAARAVPAESLASHFTRATRTERIEFARTAGVDLLWDELIQPLID
jgi:hypothetical protein